MFEKLIDLLVSAWDRVSPFEVIKDYEGAVVLRFGRYTRTLAPGLHLKIPIVEEAILANTCVSTLRLPPQTLTTKDDVPVVVSAIVKYQIKNVRDYIMAIYDRQDVLADVTMGAIRMAVNGLVYADLVAQPPEDALRTSVRREVGRYGFDVLKVTFTDLGRVKSLRLIQPLPTNIEN